MASPVLERARPALASLSQAAGRRPAPLVGAIAGIGAALAGLLVTGALALAAWGITTGGSMLDGLETAVLGWTLAHGLPVMVGGVEITLVPWGWVALPVTAVALVARRARAVAPCDRPIDAAGFAAGLAFAYGIAVGVGAVIGDGTGAEVIVVRAVAQGGLIAAVVALAGAPAIRALVPLTLRPMLRAGAIAAAAVTAIAALLLVISLLAHLPQAGEAVAYLAAGPAGGIAALLLQLGYVPVLIGWSAAFLVGTPVALPAGGILSAFLAATPPAELPALPLLAAVPVTAPALAWALPVLAVASGGLAGLVIGRSGPAGRRVLALRAVGAAGVACLLLGALAVISGGSLGTQRLAYLGPMPVAVIAASFTLLAIGALPTAWAVARGRTAGSGA